MSLYKGLGHVYLLDEMLIAIKLSIGNEINTSTMSLYKFTSAEPVK